jgi:hypothetical protein
MIRAGSILWLLSIPALASGAGSPFVGRWDFDIKTTSGVGACWLGVTEKTDGKLDVWFQPTGGHVRELKDVQMSGSHLVLTVAPATTWDLESHGAALTGVEKHGAVSTPLEGNRAPELKRSAPKTWSKPEALFNGKNLNGWQPIGDPKNSHWLVKDGLLYNETRGANLKSDREFEDFKVHFEVKCPNDANSGFYLRGRYEVQLEYEPANTEPKEREMGAIYGRIAPAQDLPRKPGEWETFDITLVGRIVTIVRDGVKTVDAKEIEGITGGALNADEGKPGPFYIQGDHTGGLAFRNITVSVPAK